jgi:hypothetical protein
MILCYMNSVNGKAKQFLVFNINTFTYFTITKIVSLSPEHCIPIELFIFLEQSIIIKILTVI